jgi:hypothetical protein
MGRVGWIKLFRTKSFEKVQYRDLIASDLVFTHDITKQGWKIMFALRPVYGASRDTWHTFGEHRPSYTPAYTFSKYLLEGRKYRYRKAPWALIWHLKRLAHSTHPAALVAQIALAHGIFIRDETDLLRPYLPNEEFAFLQKFFVTTNAADLIYPRVLPRFGFSAKKTFQQSYQLGIRFRQAQAFPAFKQCLEYLTDNRDPLAWVFKIGLCHGLFSETYRKDNCSNDYTLFKDLLAEHHRPSVLKSKLRQFVSRLRTSALSSRPLILGRRIRGLRRENLSLRLRGPS